MTVLPIVGRELRAASRRRATYAARLAVALAGLILGAWLFLLPGPTSQQTGLVLFTGVAIFAFVCCGLAGVLTTADCLSAEKREGTLGLLFLTDLRSYDIVLGKLSASSLSVIYAVLALFPILAIPLIMGGVTLHEFVRVALAALNTLFFSLAVGVFVSSISRDERRAMGATFLLVLLFSAGFPMIGALMDEWNLDDLGAIFRTLGTGYSCMLAFEAVRGTTVPAQFTISMVSVHGMGWAFLLLSMFAVRRSWQDKADSASQTWKLHWLTLARHGSPLHRLAFRRELLGINPFYWLLARNRVQMWFGWVPLLVAGLIWAYGLTFEPRSWKDPASYFMTALVLHAVFKWWIATEAGRRVALDRASGALELLLSTPLTVSQICRGQFLGMSRQFFGPMLVLLAADFILLLTDRREGLWVGMFLVGMILLVADYFTLARVGLWLGVTSRNPSRAASATIVRILVLPVVLYGLMWTVLFMQSMHGRPPAVVQSSSFALYSYLFFGLAVDLFFYRWATTKIEDEFRHAATTRFQGRSASASA